LDANVTFIEEDMGVMTDFELDRLCRKFPESLDTFQLDIVVGTRAKLFSRIAPQLWVVG
jgi:hypothetical protein